MGGRSTRLALVMAVTLGAIIAAIGATAPADAAEPGHLVLVGGGPTPAQVFERALALSGGRRAIVAVLPQTYPDDSIADAAVAMWKTFAAAEVVKVSRTDMASASADLSRATLIWIPGGFPVLFMRSLDGTPLPDVIRARFAAGVTVGGASAGAVAVCETMIDDESPVDALRRGPATAPGLGLWREATVSPHFTERRRLNALQAVVASRPSLVGVGLDEGAAVVVSRGKFDVLGRGTVVVVGGDGKPRALRRGTSFRYSKS